MPLAIFDLDNTLISGDSDYGWGQFMVAKNLVDADYYQTRNEAFYRDYVAGCLDHNAYLRFALEPLSRLSMKELDKLHDEFMDSVIKPWWLPAAENLLERHRLAGDFLLVVTSTNRFIVEPICRRLGVDDLIATDPEIADDHYTGNIVGTAAYGQGKVVRLDQWLSDHPHHDLAGSWFYSDSINDLPLLSIVDHPVAVDPDPQLRQRAKQEGWDIISLRDK